MSTERGPARTYEDLQKEHADLGERQCCSCCRADSGRGMHIGGRRGDRQPVPDGMHSGRVGRKKIQILLFPYRKR